MQEKYIELMCQFEPAAAVRAFLDSSEGNYRLEETLQVSALPPLLPPYSSSLCCRQICRRHSVREAVAYLLEKAGDVHGALDILLQVAFPFRWSCARAVLRGGRGVRGK